METKQAIIEIVSELPNDILDDLLLYLKQVERVTHKKMRLSLNLRTILLEDRELLIKLAQ